MPEQQKQHFVIVDDKGSIEAVIFVRGGEFYCYERFEDAPRNFAEAMKHYPGCKLLPVKLSAQPEQAEASRLPTK